jgi:hypothetical protein
MRIASSVHTQSGGISATVMALTALGGFAAGALVAGVVALAPHSASGSNASARISAELGAPPSAAGPPPASTEAPPPPAVPATAAWSFEAATPRPRGGLGRKRPDLLSAPEGWTYDPGP